MPLLWASLQGTEAGWRKIGGESGEAKILRTFIITYFVDDIGTCILIATDTQRD